MRSVFALTIAATASLGAAQSTSEQNYPYTIDPSTVDQSTRDYWCQQNQAQCPLICLQQPGVTSETTQQNDCDSDALTYTCICDDGSSPNITQYSQTLPYFICTQWGNNCVAACNGDNNCQSKCRQDHPCGAQSPFKGNATASSSMSTATQSGASATSKVPVTGFGGAAATSASSSNDNKGAGAVFVPNAGLGLAALLGSVFFGFAVLL